MARSEFPFIYFYSALFRWSRSCGFLRFLMMNFLLLFSRQKHTKTKFSFSYHKFRHSFGSHCTGPYHSNLSMVQVSACFATQLIFGDGAAIIPIYYNRLSTTEKKTNAQTHTSSASHIILFALCIVVIYAGCGFFFSYFVRIVQLY